MSGDHALEARKLSVTLGVGRHAHRVLKDVDLSLARGRWTCVVGPNGAGKSTLLKALAGLLPASGDVWLQGKPSHAYGHRERARLMAWLAQGGASEAGAEDLSAYDVVMLGRLPHQAWLAPPSAEDHATVRAAMESTKAWAWRDRPLGQLSGGERQRVLLARVLAVGAPIMLMDEPLANLDPPQQADWVRLVRQQVAAGHTVVSVLHEVSLALQADDLVVVNNGQVLHAGPASEPAARAALMSVFEQRLNIVEVGGRWVALPD
ncbi:ABC transporter ATP-binding protein [Hydrogenophaga sp. 5NK40-0174]|uniref:ABC transporter ATP-binding protein n=1 Tax=Hydrogenophaga sp. 5NK40-0174 TaxID=3127649 RepID=UPI0031089C06